MSELFSDLAELHEHLGRGSIQRAYTAIISYMSALRTQFATTHGEWAGSAIYQGYFDMTYFALAPPALKARDLKLAIVFNYEAFRFEIWLAARNRKLQRHYWQLFRDQAWSMYRLVEPAAGIDAIVEHDVAGGLDLADREALTSLIERSTEAFLEEIERFLEVHDPR